MADEPSTVLMLAAVLSWTAASKPAAVVIVAPEVPMDKLDQPSATVGKVLKGNGPAPDPVTEMAALALIAKQANVAVRSIRNSFFIGLLIRND